MVTSLVDVFARDDDDISSDESISSEGSDDTDFIDNDSIVTDQPGFHTQVDKLLNDKDDVKFETDVEHIQMCIKKAMVREKQNEQQRKKKHISLKTWLRRPLKPPPTAIVRTIYSIPKKKRVQPPQRHPCIYRGCV